MTLRSGLASNPTNPAAVVTAAPASPQAMLDLDFNVGPGWGEGHD